MVSENSPRARLKDVPETRSNFGSFRLAYEPTDTGRAVGEDGRILFSGYASTYDQPYSVYDFMGMYEETMASGAFSQTVAESPDVVFLVNHEGLPLARTTAGNLTLESDNIGLRVDAELNAEDPDVKALIPKIERGDITEMSIAFRVTEQEWNEDYTERTITAAELDRGDVSVVTYGANPHTTASLRAALQSDPQFRAAMIEVLSSMSSTQEKEKNGMDTRSDIEQSDTIADDAIADIDDTVQDESGSEATAETEQGSEVLAEDTEPADVADSSEDLIEDEDTEDRVEADEGSDETEDTPVKDYELYDLDESLDDDEEALVETGSDLQAMIDELYNDGMGLSPTTGYVTQLKAIEAELARREKGLHDWSQTLDARERALNDLSAELNRREDAFYAMRGWLDSDEDDVEDSVDEADNGRSWRIRKMAELTAALTSDNNG